MKFGLVLVSYVYNQERATIASRTLTSLAKTNVEPLPPPILQCSFRTSGFDYSQYIEDLNKKFRVIVDDDVPGSSGNLNSFVSCTANKLLENKEVTHIVFLYDDFVYNTEWLQELYKLIFRHPDARAWSVYRSAYVRSHRILRTEYTDCVMTMHDGLGCLERWEWEEYIATTNGDFSVGSCLGGGNTIDIHHACARLGDRWATGRDYWQNIGVHMYLGKQDQAIDFVGE